MSTRSFTEAVPLSLSSMAHLGLPLENGVLDGINQVLQHTLMSCTNYARVVHPPHEWTFRDLTTSRFAWQAVRGEIPPRDLPQSLTKLGFKHQYPRHAWIYLKDALIPNMTFQDELANLKTWTRSPGILGRVSLLYATQELLTHEELNGLETEDIPPTVLYKVVVEYRSLPATGNKQAVQAEELSMLSFGGSVDDDVKYGALASLYDDIAKYVLEIYSVRGKKYKFDLMDSTLSDGRVPRLASRDNDGGSNTVDPFVKSLCLTVTDHASSLRQDQNYAIQRIHLTLEGPLRQGNKFSVLPPFDYYAAKVQDTFLNLRPQPPTMVTATPSGQTLLLDPDQAGKVYINGRYITKWGQDPRIGSHALALFGMDLHSIPFWHGRIMDYDVLKATYAQLWQEVLIDFRLMTMDIGGKLLHRLIHGRDKDSLEQETPDTSADCLEAQIIYCTKYDRVGISAKALATRFAREYGKDSFPCLEHEVEWVKTILPWRVPMVVPQRLINVLRRGGYFDAKRTADETWAALSRPVREGLEFTLVETAVKLLEEAGCNDVHPMNIVFVSGLPIEEPVARKAVCRFREDPRLFHVNEKLLEDSVLSKFRGDSMATENGGNDDDFKLRALLLGLYIAKEHPDGDVLIRYLLRHEIKA